MVTVYPNDTENITVPEESNVTLRCEATGEGTFSYQWIRVSQRSSEVDLNNNNTYLTILNINVSDTGIYFCKVDNGGTSVSSMGVHVIVKSKLHKRIGGNYFISYVYIIQYRKAFYHWCVRRSNIKYHQQH